MKRLPEEQIKKMIESKNGELLSISYLKKQLRVKIRCNVCKYEWETYYLNIRKHNGTWCPGCHNKKRGYNKLSLIDCIKHAESKNGKCLSTVYVGIFTKMTWQCELNHVWEAVFNKIKNVNHWCPFCINKRKESNSMLKYGCKSPNHVREIALKQARASNKQFIKTHWLTSEELVCQASWEAKVVDYLNQNQINYKWQPETFKLSTGNTYRPDLYLVDTDTWVEIKGWMRPKAKLKWDEFKKLYPTAELWDQKKLKELKIL